ncbi:MAG: hypothetical protein CSA96_07365 [Bacteroidetes bacterium]|nr:MAG: hypothetical protein CSA96_07365 [Bacteroidota bacterium]
MKERIVIVNQAANYLTIGFCNAFKLQFREVCLITGSIHVQGESLDPEVQVRYINKWRERPARKKLTSYLLACWHIVRLLRTKYRKHEVLFVSLPPMAYLLNLLVPNRCSMVVWDVYPDVFKVTGMRETHPLYRIWRRLNRKSFKKAFRLFTISEKMAELLGQYTSQEDIVVLPIWSIFQENNRIARDQNPFVEAHRLQDKFVVQYSGNIGLTHKVEVVVRLAELLRSHTSILFQIIGRGPRVPYLRAMVEEKGLPNCVFLPFQSDEMFPYSLSAADLGVVVLDESTSKGSVPSKSYNLMSFGIPSLYLASEDSELMNYTRRFGHGRCFRDAELEDAAQFIQELARDREKWSSYSRNAEQAAENFRRGNADRFVEAYIK